MNKQQSNTLKTRILLVVVIIIWGLVGYQIYNGLKGEETFEVATFTASKSPVDISLDFVEFDIAALDRDPFLGKLTSKENQTFVVEAKSQKLIDSLLMHVKYLGMVKKQNSDKQIFMVNYRNEQRLLKINQYLNDTRLIYGDENKLHFSYQNATKIISR